jgi:carboxypeptidase Q
MKYKYFTLIVLLYLFIVSLTYSQIRSDTSRPYTSIARQIIEAGLKKCMAYETLRELTSNIGPRLSGSRQAEMAVHWGKKTMEKFGFDSVWLEPVMVPHWVRGKVEEAEILMPEKRKLNICALGGSIATPKEGITAEVIEVQSFDELNSLGKQAKGKIIFFNRPMDPTKFSTGEAYGGAVNQRSSGAIEAARVGAVATLVRSMTTALDDIPHTGAMHYNDSIPKVSSAAISTSGANNLSDLLNKEKKVVLRLKLDCETLPDVESANVIGELRGTEKPNEVILIGAHLDSWDKGQGAHDDGAGCAHVIEALRLLKEVGVQPKRTIRAVLFMNEENGLNGAKAYASKERPNEKHIVALESDAGGFSPRGFGISADSLTFENIAKWSYLFEQIDANNFRKGGGGADINELAKKGVPTIGVRVDGQKYFDYHHSDNDTFDKVDDRELELGAISIAILVYVLAQEGL